MQLRNASSICLADNVGVHLPAVGGISAGFHTCHFLLPYTAFPLSFSSVHYSVSVLCRGGATDEGRAYRKRQKEETQDIPSLMLLNFSLFAIAAKVIAKSGPRLGQAARAGSQQASRDLVAAAQCAAAYVDNTEPAELQATIAELIEPILTPTATSSRGASDAGEAHLRTHLDADAVKGWMLAKLALEYFRASMPIVIVVCIVTVLRMVHNCDTQVMRRANGRCLLIQTQCNETRRPISCRSVGQNKGCLCARSK